MMRVFTVALIGLIAVIPTFNQGMGPSTGEARAYSSRRTAGIVDSRAAVVFEDVTARTALDGFRNVGGDKAKNYIVETVSAGVAVLDYDNDGNLDVYLLSGGTIDGLKRGAAMPASRLYRNLGNWKFEDVTARAGVANERWGMGVAVGDYDNNGFPDIFVTNFGTARLYRNNGNGTFTDVAERAGVNVNGWYTGASFGDYDRDGRLDLFVPGYVELDLNSLPRSPEDAVKAGLRSGYCQFRGEPTACGPRGLKGAGDKLFRQKVDGTFEDVSKSAGVDDPRGYYGFASTFLDVDDDSDLDLVVVNDSTPNQLYINKGNGTFEETGYASGMALNENGREQAGMGLGVGDYDNDGRVDVFVTNFSDDSNTLRRNDGDGVFTDVTVASGLAEPSLPFLGWGTAFVDYDNDGWKDILAANGHIYPQVDNFQWGTSYAQQLLLFKNRREDSKGKHTGFERVGAAPGSGLAIAIQARGLATGDLDNDGREDAVINNIDAKPTVLRNVSKPQRNWISFKLIGDISAKSPKDAIGAVVFLSSNGVRQRAEVLSGASYASQSSQRVHFGLGDAAKVDKLEVRWPSGRTDSFVISDTKQIITLTEQGEKAKL